MGLFISTEHVPLQNRLLAVICRLQLLVTGELAGCPWMCSWLLFTAMVFHVRLLQGYSGQCLVVGPILGGRR